MGDARDQARYRILGPVSVRGRTGLGAPKQRAVLAALLLNANRMVSEEQLFTLVWGENTPRSVLGRVRVYVHELRALLGRDVIDRVRAGYRIRVEPGELDLDMFDQAVAEARVDAREGRAAEAASRLRDALALWAGPALGGVSAPLVEREGSALEERRLIALEELFDAELAAGRHVQVVAELRKAAADNPLRERLQAQLMLALHRSQRRSEALSVYLETHHRLVEELGIEPGQALREIHQQVLDPVEEQPAAGIPHARPAELPRDIRGFTGRDAELRRLDSAAATDAICLISGTAGIGKTALAVHWAHTRRERFPDGQLYVNLRGFDPDHEPLTPIAAMAQLLHSLGVAPGRVPDGLDQQTGLYRSLLADREVLVVLDNARDAEQVRPLLPPAGVALVTSRNRLGGLVAEMGAHQVAVSEMSEVESRALLAGVLGTGMVTAEVAASVELAQLCGGLPLALRIAAANVATVPGGGIAAVVAELAKGDRLAGLSLDGDDSPVTVAFTASYRALKTRSQQLFRMLGLIPGPDFTAAAAAAVSGLPLEDTARELKALSAAHLVEQHTTDRYRFHDLVRLFAGREVRLDPDRERARGRLLDYYAGITSAASQLFEPDILRLPGNPVGPSGYEAAEVADLPNLAAAMLEAAARGPFPQAWWLADDLRVVYQRNGRRGEWIELAAPILSSARRHGEPEVQAMLLNSIGEPLFRSGQRERAIEQLNRSAAMARECGWPECEAASLAGLSFALEWTGRLPESISHNQKAAALFAELGSVVGENRTLHALAEQYHHLGRLRLAEDTSRQALDISRRHGLRLAMARDLRDLGAILLDRGQFTESEEFMSQARAVFQELGMHDVATTFTWMSRLRWETGDFAGAYVEAVRAVELSRSERDQLSESAALIAQADAEIGLGRLGAAAEHLDLADAIVDRGSLRWHLAYGLTARARLNAELGEFDTAIENASRAGIVARQSGYRLPELAAVTALALIYSRSGQDGLAAVAAADALDLCRDIGHTSCEAVLSPLVARLGSDRIRK
ncbi:BTAD domain-containing putative transcriptional regulator [Actinocrispum sp. NPDC049592]|uniref:AfsR/SARP family transcriptional regulator n=1 Tax=Actinocrispum sp. NPDC049592 TaxID=3154835 RepID=UPI003447893F